MRSFYNKKRDTKYSWASRIWLLIFISNIHTVSDFRHKNGIRLRKIENYLRQTANDL